MVLALHDSDQMRGLGGGAYLRRSAELLRRSIKPSLKPMCNAIDKEIRLLLDAAGPIFRNKAYLERSGCVRRVGNLWYTKAFAEKVFQEMLLHHAKAEVQIFLGSQIEIFAEYVQSSVCFQVPWAGEKHLAAFDVRQCSRW